MIGKDILAMYNLTVLSHIQLSEENVIYQQSVLIAEHAHYCRVSLFDTDNMSILNFSRRSPWKSTKTWLRVHIHVSPMG